MISLRSSEGTSSGETKRDMILKARSSKLASAQLSQFSGREGISSGMNRPPSLARPFITTSSKDFCTIRIGSANLLLRIETPHLFFKAQTYSGLSTPSAEVFL